MIYDALFQLEMGPVELVSTQTEEFLSSRSRRDRVMHAHAETVRRLSPVLGENSTKVLIKTA